MPIATAPFQETVIANAAAAKIKGVEIDFTARLTLRGSAGMIYAPKLTPYRFANPLITKSAA